MTGPYWHLLDEAEWAELTGSEPPPVIDGDAVGGGDSALRALNGATPPHPGAALEAIACTQALSVDAELASVVSCLGLPLEIVGGARTRMALDRLQDIQRDRAGWPAVALSRGDVSLVAVACPEPGDNSSRGAHPSKAV